MKLINALFRLIYNVRKYRNEYNTIKQDAQKRPVYVGYGVKSIAYSILAISSAMAIFLLEGIQAIQNPIAVVVLFIFVVALAIVAPFIFAFHALFNSILQIRLNKKAIGWVALALFVLTFVPSVIIILAQLGK